MAVYFIQAGEGGPIKIGATTSDPWSRMASFQGMHFAELRMLGVAPGRFAEEKEIQVRFVRHWLGGEWFRPDPEILAFAAQHYVPPPAGFPKERRYRNGTARLKKAHDRLTPDPEKPAEVAA